jgi:hypothetical protein
VLLLAGVGGWTLTQVDWIHAIDAGLAAARSLLRICFFSLHQ